MRLDSGADAASRRALFATYTTVRAGEFICNSLYSSGRLPDWL